MVCSPKRSNLRQMPFLKLKEVGTRLDCGWTAWTLLCLVPNHVSTCNLLVLLSPPPHSLKKILQLEDQVFCRLGFLFQERSDEFWLALRSDCELVLPYARLALFAARSSSVSSSLQREYIFCVLCFVFCILYFAVRRFFCILHFVFCREEISLHLVFSS